MSRRHDIQEGTGRIEYLPGRGTLQAWGPGNKTDGTGTPTNSVSGYAPGCLWQDLINGNVYINTGTFASSTWTLIETAAILAAAVLGVAAGYKLARGETALDGSNPTPVTTGLTTIVAATTTIKLATAPGVGTSVITYDTTAGTLNLYAWKVTSNADPTLVASTGTETIGWTAIGT